MTTITVDISSLAYNGVTLDWSSLTQDEAQRAAAYLLDYGFGKSLQDSVAGMRKKLESEGTAESEIAQHIAQIMTERRDNIFAGTISSRGPRLSGEAKIRAEVIEDLFKAWVVARKFKLPAIKKDMSTEDKESVRTEIAAIRERWLNATSKETGEQVNLSRVAAETTKRLAEQAARAAEADDLDLDI